MTENAHEYIRMLDQNGNEVEVRAYTINDPNYGVGYNWWLGAPGGTGYPPNASPNPTNPGNSDRAVVSLVDWGVTFTSRASGPKLYLKVQSDKSDVISFYANLISSQNFNVAYFSVGSKSVVAGLNEFTFEPDGYDLNYITEAMSLEFHLSAPNTSSTGGFGEIFSGSKFVAAPAGRGFNQTFSGRVTESNKIAEFTSQEPLKAGDVVTLTGQWITLSSATIKLTPSANNTGPTKSLSATTSTPANGSVTYTVTSDTYLTGRITWTGGRALDYTLTMSFSS